MYKNIFLFGVIILAGFLALKDSFYLSLFGDDWLAFWRYNYHLGPQSLKEFNHLSYFLTVYGPQDVIMGLLEKVLGMNSPFYFIISFSFRMFAALSLFPLVYYVTKSRFAGFLAALFFAVSFIGIETTNWVFNMPSYLGIAFFNLFLYFFFVSREPKQNKKIFIAALFFYLAFVTAPIRMTGLPIMVMLLEGFWFLQNKSYQTVKKILIRIGILAIVFLLVKFGGQSLGITNDHLQRLLIGLTEISTSLSAGRSDILLNPFITIGALFIPDSSWNTVLLVKHPSMFLSLYLPFFVIFLSFVLLITKTIKSRFIAIFLISNVCLGIIWTLFVRYISKQNLLTFNDSFKVGEALIGGYVLILLITLILRYKNTTKGTLFFLSLVILLLSFALPWFFAPGNYITTSHRYLILTSIGVSLIWAALATLFSHKIYRAIFTTIFIVCIVLQVQANQQYFAKLTTTRGNGISDTIWTQVLKELPDIKTTPPPLVFYFEGTTENSDTINDVITFGFPPHIAFLYDLYHDHDRIPIPLTNYKELKQIVMTGKPLPAYGRKEEPLPLSQIYAFKLEGRTKLINITKQTRDSLTKLKENNQ